MASQSQASANPANPAVINRYGTPGPNVLNQGPTRIY